MHLYDLLSTYICNYAFTFVSSVFKTWSKEAALRQTCLKMKILYFLLLCIVSAAANPGENKEQKMPTVDGDQMSEIYGLPSSKILQQYHGLPKNPQKDKTG